MAIRTVQTVINIGGSSRGVTLPAKDLKYEGIETGDEIEIIARKRKGNQDADNSEVLEAAKKILNDYREDFENLAQR